MVRSFAPVLIADAPSPVKLNAPEVAVALNAPAVKVKLLEAVSDSATVREPLFVVSIPDAPRLIDAVLAVPIEIVPFVSPEPALTVTFPPVEPVPDDDSLPALKTKLPP